MRSKTANELEAIEQRYNEAVAEYLSDKTKANYQKKELAIKKYQEVIIQLGR